VVARFNSSCGAESNAVDFTRASSLNGQASIASNDASP
jgi:hypothetical protein